MAASSISNWRVVFLGVLILLTIFLALKTNAALDFRVEYLEGPDAKKVMPCGPAAGEEMAQGDCLLRYILRPQVGPILYDLMGRRSRFLWSLLYILCGISGSYIYYLFLLVQPASPARLKAFGVFRLLARLALAGFFGFVCYLLIRPLSGPLAKFLLADPKGMLGAGEETFLHSILDTMMVLPVLAGMFLSTFYNKLGELLSAFMDLLRKWVSR